MRNLLASLPSAPLATLLPSVWRWWLGELHTLVPDPILELTRSRSARIAVDIQATEVVVGRIDADGYREIARIPRDDHGAVLPILGARPWLAAGRNAEIVVRLPSHQVLRRRLSLPAAQPRTLRKLLDCEIDRQCPIAPEQVWFDHVVRTRDRTANRLEVDLRMVRRATARQAVALCRALGLEPTAFGFIGDDHDGDPGVFLAGSKGVARRWRRRAAFRLAVGLPLVLALAVAGAALLRAQARWDALAAAVDAAKAEAQAVNDLRREVDQARHRTQFLPQLKQAPLVTRTLAEVTRLLPDGSWLIQLDLQGSEVRIQGYSPAASALIASFDGSEPFTNARFRAPLTPGPRSELERFDLSFELRGGRR